MGHALFFDTFLRLAGLWLGRMLSWLGPPSRAAMGQLQPTAAQRAKTPTTAPKPLAGRTHQPLCEAGQPATETHQQALFALPPRRTCPRGRRRTMDPQQPCCPDQECSSYGGVGRGTSRGNGHPGHRPWRHLQGVACHPSCQETQGTPLHGQRVASARRVGAVGAVAEGVGLRAVARVFEVAPHTGLAWLGEGADQAAAVGRPCLHAGRVTPVQLEARCALRRAGNAGEGSEAETSQRLSRSPPWVGAALAPVTTRRLTSDVGARTRAMAQCAGPQGAQVVAPDGRPRWLTEGDQAYVTALLRHGGQWGQPPRRQANGPTPKPRGLPLPQWL